jgi:hypothetical protein
MYNSDKPTPFLSMKDIFGGILREILPSPKQTDQIPAFRKPKYTVLMPIIVEYTTFSDQFQPATGALRKTEGAVMLDV